ncbi:multidrug effflux MFS transporter [Spirosoma pollinicola]|uniref:Bcr/CflA family drug resistance efflux transporter n=1 Tax=Spirosoma pollinicola TaxID=2057025 RepID=A0A2K8YV46_9BACT|nr:multidrug effflux MFS transporter [Spirosoma pollinicola]AUD01459.1 Bcr/CflA family drug resistance efflux transporter [Spirosoma pollinicola]
MTRRRHLSLILILGAMTALGPFSIDMYLPGFPAIANDLHTTVPQVALSLSSFFIGISAGQLLYGPLLDRFGRKKPLYVGLSLFILTSIGCMTVTSIDWLIALRFLQAIGSCSAGVAAVAMVRDLFPVEENAKVFALLMLVLGLSPLLAPTLGGYVTATFGWQSVFVILGVLGVVLLFATRFGLPNGYLPDTTMSLKPLPILTNFLAVLRVRQFSTYALTGGMSFAGLFAYVADSPLVFMDIFQVSGQVYGWIFAGLSVGLIGASQVNSFLLRRYRSEQLIFAALSCQVAITLVFLLLTVLGWLGLVGTLVLLFAFLCCLGIISPNTGALSLAPFTKNAGSASALMGATQMGLGALASVSVSLLNNHTAIPMVGIMAATSLLALLILLWGRKSIRYQGVGEELLGAEV